jgi:hypothetical protein
VDVDLEPGACELVGGAEHHGVADRERRTAGAAQLGRREVLDPAAGGLRGDRSEQRPGRRRA